MSRNRRRNPSQNPIRVSDEIPICEDIRQMAENLQNNDFSNLVVARPIRSGMRLIGIANGEIQLGDMVTFEYDESGCPHVRKLTFEEVQLITNGEITSNNTINRVENIARACRFANAGDAIEFIIDTCCDNIAIHDINALPLPLYHINSGPPKLHKLDEDYPHVCYKCKKKLKYLEAWQEVKKTKMTEEKFQHLWELEQIEFYCCSCYDKEVRKEKPHTHSITTPFRNSQFAWNLADYRERVLWQGSRIFEEHEHVFSNGQSCNVCGRTAVELDVEQNRRNSRIQRTNTLSDL